jgi:hypothetical protein
MGLYGLLQGQLYLEIQCVAESLDLMHFCDTARGYADHLAAKCNASRDATGTGEVKRVSFRLFLIINMGFHSEMNFS